MEYAAAKHMIEQALTLARSQFERAEAGRDAKCRRQKVSRDAAALGHADRRGKKDALLALFSARAQSVYHGLLSRGIEAKRLSSTGMGGDEPATGNRSAGGRDSNNHVEIVLIR